MKSCLIVGYHSAFSNSIIERFDKEGWKVFTFSDIDNTKNQHAFRHYQYEYNENNIANVFESAVPNVVIYLGAYDPVYIKNAKQAERYIGNLESFLYHAGEYGVGHFLYLSSAEVFEQAYPVDITEEMPAHPSSRRPTLLYQSETLVQRFADVSAMDVTVLRLDNLYCTPDNADECNDVCTKMVLHAMRQEQVDVNYRHSLPMLYASDAIEAIYRVVSAPARKHSLYHVSTETPVNEEEIAQLIDEKFETPIRIYSNPSGVESKNTLSAKRIREEFGFEVKFPYQTAVPKLIESMLSRQSSFLGGAGETGKSAGGVLRKILRFIVTYGEVVLLVLFAAWLTVFWSRSFGSTELNFFLLVTLLLASFYGTKHGIAASTLSSVCYLYLRSLKYDGFEMLADIETYIWIAQIFIVALAVGFVRDRLSRVQGEMDTEIDFLHGQLSDVETINTSNVQLKNYFETKVIDSSESVGFVYSIISRIENADDSAVLFEATDILMTMMGSRHISIYQVANADYLRIVSSTGERSRSLGMSIKREDYARIFTELEEKFIYVNRSLNPNLPNFVGRLNDADGNMSFIILLWDLPYDHMSVYYVNLFRVICTLLGNAVNRSVRFLNATSSERIIDGTRIMREDAFNKLVEIYHAASKKKLTEFSLLELSLDGESAEAWDKKLKGLFRFTDNIGLCESEGMIRVLLTNTDPQSARFVVSRLVQRGIYPRVLADSSTLAEEKPETEAKTESDASVPTGNSEAES